MPTPMEDYLFDLRGYLVLQGAVSPEQVQRINAAIDAIPPLQNGEWWGNVQGHTYHGEIDGRNLQNIVEGGPAFEELIDHPAWIEHVRRYVGKKEGLFIDECFVTLRGPGEFINIHSGGHLRWTRTQYRYEEGQWHCGMINILLALTDIVEMSDGPTVVIPGSHKSQLVHPTFEKGYENMLADPPELVEGTVPVFLKAGDALLFVDALCHGGASRTKPGIRRTLVYRYGPYWGNTRFGYRYSPELIARLTPERAKILQPIPPRQPPGAVV
ncbi:MAG TPA: phytanoyl-CoA dioxygenase family protein [Chthonomonadaceae bacterium]|nr:phytanoyl-CoA dioxygenase family protein [Chthonomonadaceae bacterium]